MMMPGIKRGEVGRTVKALHPKCAMVYVSGYIDSIRLRQELPEDAVFVSKLIRTAASAGRRCRRVRTTDI